jgi:hypothetical protein
MSAARTTVVTIVGNFSSFRAETENCQASMQFVSPSGLFRACQKLVVGQTSATCQLVRGKPFPLNEQRKLFPRLQLCSVSGAEVVAHPEPSCCSAAPYLGRIDIALRIDSTSPASGSLAGGTTLTIHGAGFGPLDGRIVRSALTYNYFDEMTVSHDYPRLEDRMMSCMGVCPVQKFRLSFPPVHICHLFYIQVVNISTDHKNLPCTVVSSNFTTITCKTPMLNATDAEPHTLAFGGR